MFKFSQMKLNQQQPIFPSYNNPNTAQHNMHSNNQKNGYANQNSHLFRNDYTQAQFNFEDQITAESPSQMNQPDPETDFLRNAVKQVEPSIRQTVILHNHSIVNKQNRPNNQEISKCLTEITKKYPKIHLQKIILALHELVHDGCKKGTDNSSEDSQKMAEMGFYTQFPDYTSQNRQRMSQNALPIDARFSEQKRIAISFLNSGYGLRILRQQIRDPNISAPKYNNTITTVIKLAFRKVQQCLKAHGYNIEPISTHQQKILRAPLINGDKWLPPDQLETFHKFIKASFGIQIANISIPQAYKLYNCCKLQLKQREANEMAIIRSRQSNILKKPRINSNQSIQFKSMPPIPQAQSQRSFYPNPSIPNAGPYPRPGVSFPFRFNKPS